MKKKHIGKIYKSNVYFLLLMISSMFVPIALSYAYHYLGVRDTRIMLFLNHMVLFIIPAFIYLKVTKSNIKETLRLNKLPLTDIGIVLIIAFLTYPIMGACSNISSLFFNNNIGEYMTSISDTPILVMILLFGVMPAITEEINLRGIMLSGYDNVSPFKASLMVGLFFGIFHLDLQQFLYAAVLGFIMAYVVRVTNSIFSSVLIHFVVNTSSVIIQRIVSNFVDMSEIVNEAANEIDISEYSIADKAGAIIYSVVIAAFFIFIIFKFIRILEIRNSARQIDMTNLEKHEEVRVIPNEKDKIVNLPLILILIVYTICMVLFN